MVTLAFILLAVVMLAVLAGATWHAAESAADKSRLPAPGRLVDLGLGHRLHVRCAGHGEPAVILESGIAASSLSWALVQPRVAEFTRVCSYDRAGLGWSDAGGSPVTAADHATALTRFRRHEASAACVLAGHSYGGFVNRLFAERYPHEARGHRPRRSDRPRGGQALPTLKRDACAAACSCRAWAASLARGGVVRPA